MFKRTVAFITALLLMIIAVCSCDELSSFIDDDPNVTKDTADSETLTDKESWTELGGIDPFDSSASSADTRDPSHGYDTDRRDDTDTQTPSVGNIPFEGFNISNYRVVSVNSFEINANVDGKAQKREGRVAVLMNDKNVPAVYMDILTVDGTAVECHKLFGGYCKVMLNDAQILIYQSVVTSGGIVNVNIGKHFVSNMSERGEATEDGKLKFFTLTGEGEAQRIYVTQSEAISKMFVRMLVSEMERLQEDMKYLIADTVTGTDTYEKGMIEKAGSPEEYIDFEAYKSLYDRQNGQVENAEDATVPA